MNLFPKNSPRKNGFTLIETLVGSAVFVMLALSGYKAFGVLMDAVAISQAKITATTLANEKFEIIRNLPYIDVGIVAGLPVGKIGRNETTTRDNYSFNILTSIRNVDDSFDGTIGGSPNDTSPADYKLVDLDITCSNCKTLAPLSFTTLVAPHALETASTNGALFIRVFDVSGTPIQGASLHVVNTGTNPDTLIDEMTDNEGWLKLIDAPPGVSAYNITATKTGYSEDQTYPVGGAAGNNPVKPDSTVVTQQVTQISFGIDQTSSLSVNTVNVVDSTCVALPSIGFSLTGTKLIGVGVLKYPTQNFTTDGTGNYTIPTLEWDTYSTLLTSTSYDLVGSTPLPTFGINPNENKNLQLVVTPHVSGALLVSVKDSLGVAIDGATVRLEKSGFDQTKTTNGGTCATPGQVFWNGLVSGTYTLTVSGAGYQEYVDNALNITSAWQNQTITLTP
jgi:prepilin-type N-terminal cleavage/methylation domain-containing protein